MAHQLVKDLQLLRLRIPIFPDFMESFLIKYSWQGESGQCADFPIAVLSGLFVFLSLLLR